jgi:hypothetical protein
MPWLQHEVVVVFRQKDPRNLLAATLLIETVGHQFPKVRLPFSEIVIDIDDRQPRVFHAPLQLGNASGRPFDGWDQTGGVVEGELVDHVDDQKAGFGRRSGARHRLT